ncbi:hypothetical protein DFH07DRAFT_781639 [Mycena maculata]|uniref:Uncharacterized protein n=1 Tax=Mycena maculata TaxID=230809 RepID=A0AAD7HX21_9AGAR|nr:hypothetical protein DFH07DRAFT_781639 [Mycena maculata]
MARHSSMVAHTSDNPTLIPFTYEKPMACMVDVSYALKLQHGDHETAVSDHFQREVYWKAQVNTVKARVWLETDGESITVILTVPTFPWFHPQDCPLLISLLDSINRADWSTFGYWDPADGWVITDAPIEIKDAQSILCLRLPERSQLITPASVDDTNDSDIEIPMILQERLLPVQLPANSKSKFPLKYAYQMDQGFTAMAVATTGNVQQKFVEAFGVPWTRSSYYTHLDIWSTMRMDSPDALAYAVQCGAHPGGEWGPIAQHFAKPKDKGTKT